MAKARNAISVSVETIPGRAGDPLGDEVAELLVLAHPHHHDQVEGTGDAVALGHAFDLQQLLGQRADAAGLDLEQHERGDHSLPLPQARSPHLRRPRTAAAGTCEIADPGHQRSMDNDATVTHIKETTVEKHTTVVEEPAPPPQEHHGETIIIEETH